MAELGAGILLDLFAHVNSGAACRYAVAEGGFIGVGCSVV